MVKYVVRLLILGVIISFLPDIIGEGIYVDGFTSAVIVALIMSLLNTFIKPVLTLISLPLTIATLGIFYFVINIILVYICDYFVGGFDVSGILPPLLFSFAIAISNWILGLFLE